MPFERRAIGPALLVIGQRNFLPMQFVVLPSVLELLLDAAADLEPQVWH